MGYTLLNEYGEPSAIRFIGQSAQPDNAVHFVAVVYNEFDVEDWRCEPCNAPHKRYWVKQTNGHESYHPWYEVIEPGESTHDIQVKCKAAINERVCRINVERAMAEYKNQIGVRYGERA